MLFLLDSFCLVVFRFLEKADYQVSDLFLVREIGHLRLFLHNSGYKQRLIRGSVPRMLLETLCPMCLIVSDFRLFRHEQNY